jgi:hypothetical protein
LTLTNEAVEKRIVGLCERSEAISSLFQESNRFEIASLPTLLAMTAIWDLFNSLLKKTLQK